MKTYKKYIKNIVTYFGASAIPMILGLFSNPWIAKNMDPEDYAISGYYLSFSSLIQPIIIFYMVHYYIKEYFNRDEKGRVLLYAYIAKATIWFSGLVAIGCFFALFIYLKYFNDSLSFPISPYLGMVVFSIPLTGLLNLKLANYRMEKKATSYLWLSITNGVLNIILTLVFVVWIKLGAFGKLLAPLTCNAIIFTYMIVLCKDILRQKTSFSGYKVIFSFCLPLALSAMLGYFTHGFTTTYLESLGSVNEYGYYIVGASMAGYLTTFTSAVGNTFQPDIYETTIKRQWNRFLKFCSLQIGAYLLIAILFIVCAPVIISILTAGRYDASTPYARIIALSTVTSGIYYLINNYSIATNRPRLYLYTSIFGSIFIILSLPFFVKTWQFYGGAWMSVLSFVFLSIVNLCFLCFSRCESK